jgi:hypothetical protein
MSKSLQLSQSLFLHPRRTNKVILSCLLERIARTQHGEELHRGMLSKGQVLRRETARTYQISGTARISQEQGIFRGIINMYREQDRR